MLQISTTKLAQTISLGSVLKYGVVAQDLSTEILSVLLQNEVEAWLREREKILSQFMTLLICQMIYSDFFHQRQSYCMLHFLRKVKPFPPGKQLRQSIHQRQQEAMWILGNRCFTITSGFIQVIGRWIEKPKILYFRLNEWLVPCFIRHYAKNHFCS